jgi:hypothetical protein
MGRSFAGLRMRRAEQLDEPRLQGAVIDARQGGNGFRVEETVSRIEKGEQAVDDRRAAEVPQRRDRR